MRAGVLVAVLAALGLSACAADDGGAGGWISPAAGGEPAGINEAGVAESYDRMFVGCGLTPQQDAVLRPAYRAWVGRLGAALTNPVAIIQLLTQSRSQAERSLGQRAESVSGDFDATLRRTLSPQQIACMQANQERMARR